MNEAHSGRRRKYMEKAQTRLEPGTYRLIMDFPPLREDKRKMRDWRYKPIKIGTLFFYKEWTYAPGDDETRLHTEQRLYPTGDYEHISVSPNESMATRQLKDLLTRVDDTPSLWIRREHGGSSALGALDVLVADGKVTLQEVQQAVERYWKDIEEKDKGTPTDYQRALTDLSKLLKSRAFADGGIDEDVDDTIKAVQALPCGHTGEHVIDRATGAKTCGDCGMVNPKVVG